MRSLAAPYAAPLPAWIAALAIAGALFACAPDRDRPSPTAGAAERAIQRGLAYLRADRSDVSALIVLDYLQRKYALDQTLEFEANHPAGDDDKLAVWGRFVGDDRRPDEARLGDLAGPAGPAGVTEGPGIEPIVMHALYCDRFALPAGYGEMVQRLAGRGDYELTHAALAVKLLADRGCSAADLDAAAFARRLRQDLLALLGRAPADRRFEALDVRYEALAIAQDFLAARVSPAEIARVLAEQQADGGWRPAADQQSAPHPTVMTVWALLAWMHRDASAQSFARR